MPKSTQTAATSSGKEAPPVSGSVPSVRRRYAAAPARATRQRGRPLPQDLTRRRFPRPPPQGDHDADWVTGGKRESAERATSLHSPSVDFELTPEQREIQVLARDFARAEIEPNAADWDREHRFPT